MVVTGPSTEFSSGHHRGVGVAAAYGVERRGTVANGSRTAAAASGSVSSAASVKVPSGPK